MDFEKNIQVYQSLQDQKSKDIYNILMQYAYDKDFFRAAGELAEFSENTVMDARFVNKQKRTKGVIVYGCGKVGMLTKKSIEKCGYIVDYMCDTNFDKIKNFDGVTVISPAEALVNHQDYMLVIGSTNYALEMYGEAISYCFPEENIYISRIGMVAGFNPEQYFDVFEPREDEVYVDVGVFDGVSIQRFMNWTNNKYCKIYGFEPLKSAYEVLKEKSRDWKQVEIINAGLWNENSNQSFSEGNSGSAINGNGTTTIETVKLDNYIDEIPITYLKMDIEGAELNALYGSIEIIKKYKPRLAICIYHKTEDILEIPTFIKEIVPEYKFRIRHYSTATWETVLYAEV